MNTILGTYFRKSVVPALLISASTLAGCATTSAKPPAISYDDAPAIAATLSPEAPAPVEIVTIAEPLPLPGQLMPVDERRSPPEPADPSRSEEHTSELQSLMRISYAVFCLQKKKKQTRKEIKTDHRTG